MEKHQTSRKLIGEEINHEGWYPNMVSPRILAKMIGLSLIYVVSVVDERV